MAKSRKFLAVDGRQRIALGSLARYELYFADVSPQGVITLTPAELIPVATPKPRRRPAAKKPAAAGTEPPKEDGADEADPGTRLRVRPAMPSGPV